MILLHGVAVLRVLRRAVLLASPLEHCPLALLPLNVNKLNFAKERFGALFIFYRKIFTILMGSISVRAIAGMRAGLIHLSLSMLVIVTCALLVFYVWYPSPYSDLVGGWDLFLLVVGVDLVCGPLLTMVVFDPRKSKVELIKDIGIIAAIQIAALLYGLHSVYYARPLFLAYEGRLFRVVTLPEIDINNIASAPKTFQALSQAGPILIGVTLSKGTDKDFIQSVQLSLEGLHPAFRPSRWVEYDTQIKDVLSNAKELKALIAEIDNNKDKIELINDLIQDVKIPIENMVYLPLVSRYATDWIIVLSKNDARPVGYLHIDGWGR